MSPIIKLTKWEGKRFLGRKCYDALVQNKMKSHLDKARWGIKTKPLRVNLNQEGE